VDLETNYRCPGPVVARAVRLVERNTERFAKRIVARPGAAGRLVLAPDAADDPQRIARAMATWPAETDSCAVVARTNRELLPAVVAAVGRGVPFRAPELPLGADDLRLDGLLARAAEIADQEPALPLLVVLGQVRDAVLPEPAPDDTTPAARELAAALLGWGAAFRSVQELAAAVASWRGRIAHLHRDDAALTLATAHGSKGLEWDHVVVLADGFPGRRSVSDAAEPQRALEEERRLAYVAWTRARRSLTLLFDPAAPSPFLREAFDPDELGEDTAAA